MYPIFYLLEDSYKFTAISGPESHGSQDDGEEGGYAGSAAVLFGWSESVRLGESLVFLYSSRELRRLSKNAST